ncbi:MAG: glycosyltransferase [Melioribacteraceae bacterium]|nr:glycosyltransferase [Melioribacteraceae bacterium]
MSYRYLFTVIIPTFNRSEEISELLKSLSEQSLNHEEFEVIIVDDGSDDNTGSVVNNFINSSEINTRFLKQEHKGPGEARNYGMDNALGEYILFIDSDCIADKDWLLNIKKTVVDKKPAGFGGPDKVLPGFSPMQKAIDYSMTSFITTGGIRGHSRKKISKYYPRSFNMGVRNDIVKKIGGMNKLRHGQDIEFTNRIINTGEPVIRIEDAVVYHKRRISIRKFFRQVFNWGVARINLYKIDSKMLEPVHFLPAAGTIFLFVITVLTIILPSVFIWFILAGMLVLFAMGIHGVIKYKDLRVLILIPVVVPTQIVGYGSGFIMAFLRRIVLGKDEFTGFTKRYYK